MLEEIRRLASGTQNDEEFYPKLLNHLATQLDVMGATIWLPRGDSPQLIASTKQDAQYDPSEVASERRATLLKLSFVSDSPVIHPIRSSSDPDDESAEIANTPRDSIVLLPITRVPGEAVLELVFGSHVDQVRRRQDISKASEVCRIVTWLRQRESSNDTQETTEAETDPQRHITLAQLDSLTQTVHASLEYNETAFRVVNECQKILNCDRVTVLDRKGGKWKARAISGQPAVNRRSKYVQQLENLTDRLAPTRARFWYPADHLDLPPPVETVLNDYLNESTVRSLAILPILDHSGAAQDVTSEQAIQSDDNVIGAIAFEHFTTDITQSPTKKNVELVFLHCARAFQNADRHRSLFLYPVWRAIGESKVVTAARNLPRTVTIVAIIALVLLSLFLIPARFEIGAKGVIRPENIARVFSQVDGAIVRVSALHGADVDQGDPLVSMESTDLALELERVSGELETANQQLQTIDTTLLDLENGFNRDEEQLDQLRLERVALVKRQESLDRQKELIESELAKLTVTSPISGQVITWDVDDTLRNRPIRRGTRLMEVADLDGDWILELDLPDRRIGHVLKAKRANDESLTVTFILASDPRRAFEGEVIDIAGTTEVDPEKGQTIRVTVKIDAEAIDPKQVRTAVQAKIDCGRRSLGYVWLHDVFEFVDSKVLFHLW